MAVGAMNPLGNLVRWMTDLERGGPLPRKPQRPYWCPRCSSADICGERPCRTRTADSLPPDHIWHCHDCAWSASRLDYQIAD